MKKHGDSLFQIGEITKIMGVTRKTLLVFEDMGLLTPAVKDEESGFRYYSADNMTQIRSIRSLQQLGLSLKEVRDYYYDTENINTYLHNLMELRLALDIVPFSVISSSSDGILKTSAWNGIAFSSIYSFSIPSAESQNIFSSSQIAILSNLPPSFKPIYACV